MVKKKNKFDELLEQFGSNENDRKETVVEHQIYIIAYNEHDDVGNIQSYVDEKYFTNKDKAIIHLLEQDYKHICDDEYELAWYLNAEIVLLEKGN